MEGLSDTGWYGYVRRGATRALGHVKTENAARTPSGHCQKHQGASANRIAACLALATSAKP